MKENLSETVRTINGVVGALRRFAEGLRTGAPHMLETRDLRKEAALKDLEADIFSRVGTVPMSELEEEIGADKYDYDTGQYGYSMSSYYSQPGSKSQLARQRRRREKAIDRVLRSDSR